MENEKDIIDKEDEINEEETDSAVSEEDAEEKTEAASEGEDEEEKTPGDKTLPPEPDKTSAAKAAADLNEAARQQLRLDKSYKAGRIIYKVGLALLLLLLLSNAAMYFMNIELFINGTHANFVTFYLYVIPCLAMLIGLILSAVSAKKHGLTDNDGIGIAFVVIGAVLMIGLGTVQMLSPSYRIYETQDVTIRDGEPMKIVKYLPTGIFEPSLKKLPGEYCMDIYRIDGIFCKKILSKDISYSSYVIYPDDSNDGGYLISVTSLGNEEVIPFSYN